MESPMRPGEHRSSGPKLSRLDTFLISFCIEIEPSQQVV
jgi:hypothetical protein